MLDPKMGPLNLTDQDKADLVAFMKGLTGKPGRPGGGSRTSHPVPTGQSPGPPRRAERSRARWPQSKAEFAKPTRWPTPTS